MPVAEPPLRRSRVSGGGGGGSDDDGDDDEECFVTEKTTARVVQLGDDAFRARGKIAHTAAREAQRGGEWEACESVCASARVRRALHIGGSLFTLSDGEIVATSLDGLDREWSSALHTPHVLVAKARACEVNGSAVDWPELVLGRPHLRYADDYVTCGSDSDLSHLANAITGISVPVFEDREACCDALNGTGANAAGDGEGEDDVNATTGRAAGNGLCMAPGELDVLADCAPLWHPCVVFIH